MISESLRKSLEGGWHVHHDDFDSVSVDDATWGTLAQWDADFSGEELARLIAALPDLVKALKRIEEAHDDEHAPDLAFNALRAAGLED